MQKAVNQPTADDKMTKIIKLNFRAHLKSLVNCYDEYGECEMYL